MEKNLFDRKDIQKFIIDSRNNGETEQDIYNALTQKQYNKRAIALLITGTVTPERKKKYKLYNNILLGLLGFSILLKFLTIINLTIEIGQLWTLLLILIVPLISGYFMYEIAKYNGAVYQVCGLLTLAGFFLTIRQANNITDIFVNIIFSGAIAGLSFYLGKKMFPNYSPNKLKRDSNGEYILNQMPTTNLDNVY